MLANLYIQFFKLIIFASSSFYLFIIVFKIKCKHVKKVIIVIEGHLLIEELTTKPKKKKKAGKKSSSTGQLMSLSMVYLSSVLILLRILKFQAVYYIFNGISQTRKTWQNWQLSSSNGNQSNTQSILWMAHIRYKKPR